MLSKSQRIATLTSTILASSMAFIDSTALNVALPTLQADFNMTTSSLLWVVNAYALFLSALLLTGGSLGDRHGRNKIFRIGIIVFTLASIGCGLSPTPILLIGFRAVQGIGAALMVPGSLSIISATFSKEYRGAAIGTWSMFSAMTTILGPLLGGLLADSGFWQLIFFINVPLAIASIILLNQVPETKSEDTTTTDLYGAAFATASLLGLTYGFIEAPNYGFGSPRIYGALMIGGLFLLAFLYQQSQSKVAMMPLTLFKTPMFSSANAITFFIYAALGSFMFFFPLNLIQVQGYSPKAAGLVMIPFGLSIALLSRWSGQIADKIGPRTPLIIGPALVAVGFYIFSLQGITSGPGDFWSVYFLPLILFGAGMGLTVAPLTTAVMNAAPQNKMGVASGVNNTIARTAGVLAIAIIGAFALTSFESHFYSRTQIETLPRLAQEELEIEIKRMAEAQIPESVPETEKAKIRASIETSFVQVFKEISLIATILSALSVLIAYFFIKRKSKR